MGLPYYYHTLFKRLLPSITHNKKVPFYTERDLLVFIQELK